MSKYPLREYRVELKIPLVYYIKAKSPDQAYAKAEQMAQDEVSTGVLGDDIDFERTDIIQVTPEKSHA